jgi:hypothetical protein
MRRAGSRSRNSGQNFGDFDAIDRAARAQPTARWPMFARQAQCVAAHPAETRR